MTTDTATVLPLRWRPTLEFAARLRLIRLDYGQRVGRTVTQREFAGLIRVKPPTYGSWEAGNSKPADPVETAQMIYRVTGADPSWLLGVADDNGPETPGEQVTAASRCTEPKPVLASVTSLRRRAAGVRAA